MIRILFSFPFRLYEWLIHGKGVVSVMRQFFFLWFTLGWLLMVRTGEFEKQKGYILSTLVVSFLLAADSPL